MVSPIEIKKLEWKFKKIIPHGNSSKILKYETIAECLNILNNGKTNFESSEYVKCHLYNANLTNEELYSMSNRFADQLLLESAPDDCFSVKSQQQIKKQNSNEMDGLSRMEQGNVQTEETEYKPSNANTNTNANNTKKSADTSSMPMAEDREEDQRRDMDFEKLGFDDEEKESGLNKSDWSHLYGQDVEFQLNRIERSWNIKQGTFSNNDKRQYTVGELSVNGEFLCYTIEDYDFSPELDTNSYIMKSSVPSCVAIPTGTYNIEKDAPSNAFTKAAANAKNQNMYAIYGYQKNGGETINMKNKGGSFIIPKLSNVPQREGILIHCGVDSSFSRGCILVVNDKPTNGAVSYSDANTVRLLDSSRKAYDKLWLIVQKSNSAKITVLNQDMKTTNGCPENTILAAIKQAKANGKTIAYTKTTNDTEKNA